MGSLAPPQQSALELVQWIMYGKGRGCAELLVEIKRAGKIQIDAGTKSEDILSGLLILI